MIVETLPMRAQFGFCKERDQWFWSPDSFIWIHVSRLLVPAGAEKDKVPQQDDIEVIQFLAKQQINVQNPVTPCPVCKSSMCNVQSLDVHVYCTHKSCSISQDVTIASKHQFLSLCDIS